MLNSSPRGKRIPLQNVVGRVGTRPNILKVSVEVGPSSHVLRVRAHHVDILEVLSSASLKFRRQ